MMYEKREKTDPSEDAAEPAVSTHFPPSGHLIGGETLLALLPREPERGAGEDALQGCSRGRSKGSIRGNIG